MVRNSIRKQLHLLLLYNDISYHKQIPENFLHIWIRKYFPKKMNIFQILTFLPEKGLKVIEYLSGHFLNLSRHF